MRAEIAGADEVNLGMHDGEIVAHGTFRDEHDLFGFMFSDIVHHAGRGPGMVGFCHDIG